MAEGFRVTYATLSTDDDALHADYDRAIEVVRDRLGGHHRFVVGRRTQRDGEPGGDLEELSPIDRDVLVGTFATASAADVADAVAAAQEYAPVWAATPWRERVTSLLRAADLISARRSELSALMSMEVGKSRLEALGDVEESADLIRYYCHQMEQHAGFELPMERLSAAEATSDVMRPYGVWAVISPFNFPMALSAGPARRSPHGRQHRGPQARRAGCAHRPGDRRDPPRGGDPGGCAPRRDGAGRDSRRGPGGRLPPRRGHVHGLVRGGDADLALLRRRMAEAGDLRDGRQEPRHRHPPRRPRRRRRGHDALGIRTVGPEVLGRVALPTSTRVVYDDFVDRLVAASPDDRGRQPARPRRRTWAPSSTRPRSAGTSTRSPTHGASVAFGPAAIG